MFLKLLKFLPKAFWHARESIWAERMTHRINLGEKDRKTSSPMCFSPLADSFTIWFYVYWLPTAWNDLFGCTVDTQQVQPARPLLCGHSSPCWAGTLQLHLSYERVNISCLKKNTKCGRTDNDWEEQSSNCSITAVLIAVLPQMIAERLSFSRGNLSGLQYSLFSAHISKHKEKTTHTSTHTQK